jgi:putative acetyltransferase
MSFEIRPVEDQDADALIKLIGDCFSEYEGVFLDLDDLDKDITAYETSLKKQNGVGFVVEGDGGEIVASVACAPSGEGRYELKRLYLSAKLRGSGMGLKLLHHIEDVARAAGAAKMDAWSDTRFTRAHRFYEREGYAKQVETRDLGDISNTTEFYFIKNL